MGCCWFHRVEWKTWLKKVCFMLCIGTSLHASLSTGMAPISWVVLSLNSWCSVLLLKGWKDMDLWERRIFMWSMVSIMSFVHFLLTDLSFTGWSSVYYFCGDNLEYCTSNYRWNLKGWRKATSLWNFALSAALGLQRLLVEVGLGGLLPGEEAIPRECFISILWRLIPFWLNKWESNFGAECSSILFELPHFALELLVILPMVQIVAGRLRIVANPHLRAPGALRRNDDVLYMVPDVMNCRWVVDRSQTKFVNRLRANRRSLFMVALVTAMAAGNALFVPLGLENAVLRAKQSSIYLEYQHEINELLDLRDSKSYMGLIEFERRDGTVKISQNLTLSMCVLDKTCNSPIQEQIVPWLIEQGILVNKRNGFFGGQAQVTMNASMLHIHPAWAIHALEGPYKNVSDIHWERLANLMIKDAGFIHGDSKKAWNETELASLQAQYSKKLSKKSGIMEDIENASLFDIFRTRKPSSMRRMYEIFQKHAFEVDRMASEDHKQLVPLVEGALAIMRLSCERWFPLVAVLLSFVVFWDPPRFVLRYIRFLAKTCRIFKQGILLSFPAVCWGYGAGVVFSTFATVVFWAGPIVRLVERVKKVATEVRPVSWHPVTSEEIERMGGNCAICWGPIAVQESGAAIDPAADEDSAMGLDCGHAYHTSCLLEWLHSCYGQSRRVTCPMCQSQIDLYVKYKMINPFWGSSHADRDQNINHQRANANRNGDRNEGIPGLVALAGQMPDEFVGRFEIPVGHLNAEEEEEEADMEEDQGNNGEYSELESDIPDAVDSQHTQRDDNNIDDHIETGSNCGIISGTSDPSAPHDPLEYKWKVHRRRQIAMQYDSETESSAVHEPGPSGIVGTSADAQIIVDQAESSTSSIHLPDSNKEISSRPLISIAAEEDESNSPAGSNQGPSNPGTRGIRGIYARLRPRRNRGH